jgi:hypothetical protein
MYSRLGPPGTLTLSARSHAAFMRPPPERSAVLGNRGTRVPFAVPDAFADSRVVFCSRVRDRKSSAVFDAVSRRYRTLLRGYEQNPPKGGTTLGTLHIQVEHRGRCARAGRVPGKTPGFVARSNARPARDRARCRRDRA